MVAAMKGPQRTPRRLVRETREKGKASHRGHGGHGGGLRMARSRKARGEHQGV